MMQLDPSTSSITTAINPMSSGHPPLQVEVNIIHMNRALFKAAEDGDIELFIQYQGDLCCLVDGRKNTALHIYSRTRGRQADNNERDISVNFVNQLVKKCSSLLLQPNDKGELPLHIAAKHGHSDIVKSLLEHVKVVQHDEDVEKGLEATRTKQMLRLRDKDGNTAMHKAVESGDHLDVVRLLMNELDIDSFSANKKGETPLYIAAKAKRNRSMAEILGNCKSTDYGGPNGRTALHAAVMTSDGESVKKLIEANKHLTKETDENGWTPLHYAAGYGSSSIVNVLLESDVSAAYITDKERGMTPLHMATWRGRRTIMEDIIFHCPGCCEIVDKRGWNFLHFAVVTLHPECFERFLLGDNNVIKDVPITNLLDEKDVNENKPFDILKFGPTHPTKEVFSFFDRDISKECFENFMVETKEKQIRKLLEDIAHDAELAGLPGSCSFSKNVEEMDEDQKKDISKHEIEEKARESHLLVATLVATVTFAAAFTVPGGYKSDETGTATLIRDSAFKTFVITNILAFVASLLAITLHFIFVMFRGGFITNVRPTLIRRADELTVFAMAAMMVAFSTGTYAVLQSSSEFAISALTFGLVFFPICLVFLFYLIYETN